MHQSGVLLDKDARDAKAGIKNTVSKLAMQKRAARLAREAKTRKGRR